jgi:O-antigen ligase
MNPSTNRTFIVFSIAAILAGAVFAAALTGSSFLVPLSVAFLIAGALLFLHRPILLLFALIIIRMSLDFSSQYLTISAYGLSVSLSQMIGIGVAAIGIFLLLFFRRRLRSFPLSIPFLVLGAWGAATLSYSVAPHDTLQELLRLFDLFTIGFFAYAATETKKDVRELLIAIMISSFIPTMLGWYQFMNGIGLTDENVTLPRIYGSFSHPNIFAIHLFAMVVIGTIFLFSFAKKKSEHILTASWIGIVGMTLLVTYTRVAWIAAFLFVLLAAAYRARILLVPIILVPLLLLAFSGSLRDRLGEIAHPGPDSSVVWRQEIWHDMVTVTENENASLFGYGFNTFPTVVERVRPMRDEAHNDFVKFFVEGGIVGLSVFVLYLVSLLAIIGWMYRRTTDTPLRQTAVLFGFFSIAIVAASLSDNIFKNTPLWWIFFAMLGSLLQISRVSRQAAS